jgi:hypothetical protein
MTLIFTFLNLELEPQKISMNIQIWNPERSSVYIVCSFPHSGIMCANHRIHDWIPVCHFDFLTQRMYASAPHRVQ